MKYKTMAEEMRKPHRSFSQGDAESDVPGEMDKMKKILRSPHANRKHEKTFGVPLLELLRRLPDRGSIPLMVQKVCNFIIDQGMNCEGIFRVNGNAKYVEKLKDSFDRTGDANLEDVDDVYAVAGILKLFLRELPEGVISAKTTKKFIEIQDVYMRDSTTCLKKLKVLIQQLPDENQNLLKYLCKFLVLVSSREVSNKMSPIALGIVFGPNLFRCSEGLDGLREQGITNQISCKFIVEYDTLFKFENELSPYSARTVEDINALMNGKPISPRQAQENKKRTPPARPPPPKFVDQEVTPVPSPRRHRKPEREILRDVDTISDDSCDSHGATPRGRPTQSPRFSDDEVSRSSSPFLLSVDSDGGESMAPSPRISASSHELVDRVIRATISERIFGEAVSSEEDAKSDPGVGGPVPAPRRKRNKDRKSHTDSPSSTLYKGVSTLSVPDVYGKLQSYHDQDEPDNMSDVSITVPSSYGDSDSQNERNSDSTVSTPASTPVPKPRSPKRKQVKKNSERDTQDSSTNNHIHNESDFDCVTRTPLLTGFKRDSGPKNRRSPSKTQSIAIEPKSGWVNGGLPSPSTSDKYKTYPPRAVRDDELAVNVDEVESHNQLYAINNVDSDADSKNHLQFLDMCQNGPSSKSPDISPSGGRKPYIPPLDLSILHEHGDGAEPIRAEEGPCPAFLKGRDFSEEEVLLSPRAVRMKKKNADPDTDMPPSPPIGQTPVSASSVKQEEEYTTTVKRLTKKIQTLKKKIKQYEEGFEEKNGYRPSQSVKASDPAMKTVIGELSKARKELKHLNNREFEGTKDDYRGSMEHLSEPCTSSRRSSEEEDQETPDMHYTLEVINRRLREKRLDAGRPHDLGDMDSAQVQEEKLAIQKALLYFESLHGRPSSKDEKELMRPLYDRYRNIKRIISSPKVSSDKSRELQPLPEGQAVEFSPSSNQSTNRLSIKIPTADVDDDEMAFDFLVTRDLHITPGNFENGTGSLDRRLSYPGRLKNIQSEAGLHEMDTSELRDELSKARADKRRLRRVLKEFEDEFFDSTGRKVQKEDRAPKEAEYMAYKQVKAKLRLLDALISKRDPASSL
ncbi:protein FAM13A-like isoform X3 [Lineus longissimus]|uniref:protein FAM13A-like isoform X3 n=1 Tax=Lineus longissimus TaxID=88925 RepID=UPI00315C4FEA